MRRVVTLLVGCVALIAAASASAAPPRGASLVSGIDANRAAYRGTTTSFQLIGRQAAKGSLGSPLALRVYISAEGAIRQDVQTLADGVVRTRIWAPPEASVPEAAPLDDAPGWLQLLSGRPAAEVLASKGIDTQRTGYARSGATILWVAGAGPRQPWRPQIHVERDTGRVRRLTEALAGTDPAQMVTIELAWERVGPDPAARYPSSLAIRTPDAAEPKTFDVRALTVGARLPEGTFDKGQRPSQRPHTQ